MTDRALGTCYYPEHWPEEMWEQDAARMADLGILWVRIGEFAWSRIEPAPGRLDWDWLDRAIDVLAGAGRKIILGTPTATPPRWMLERHPDMLPVDATGVTKNFGSRRHYCFSHEGYLEECRRIVTLLAERYGRDPRIAAWQTDNEYGCHGTTLSYSDHARTAFQAWCATRYGDIATLNRAWGNVFWSMEYNTFEQIDLPNRLIATANPAHRLAFQRFSSDQVVRFNRVQAEILRAHSDADILHNYMGRETAFDHFDVGNDLDIATWDSYPIGFLEDRTPGDDTHRARFRRQGDPDMQAFHHDLYRAVGHGRMWVMEQQPGPVNWAPHNPAPLPGMARLWAWEAFAHGAEVVSYFRWRQAPFAQEQYHAALRRPDDAPAPAWDEAAQVAEEIAQMPEASAESAPVALVFDYAADWAWTALPQGRECDYFDLVFEIYRGLRALGFDIDILPPTADLSAYAFVLAPGLATLPDGFTDRLRGVALLGPRTNAKTAEMETPVPLPPALPELDARIAYVESLPPGVTRPLALGGAFKTWVEDVEGTAEVVERQSDGSPALLRSGELHYLTGWPDAAALRRILSGLAESAGLTVTPLPDGLRRRSTQSHRFWFNYAPETQTVDGVDIPPAGVHWTPL